MRKTALYLFGLVVAALVALGLVILSSASQANSASMHGGDSYFFFKRQILYLALGIVVATATAMVDYRKWKECEIFTWGFFAIVMAMLIWVFFCDATKGSHRWIDLRVMKVQPGELAKLLVVVASSVILDKAGWRVELFKQGALVPAIFIGVIAVPVLLEPDFGSVMVIGLVGLLLMFVAGTKILYVVTLLLLGMGVVSFKVITNANRMARIAAFLGIKLDIGAQVLDEAAERAAYQANQALVAIGNGGMWGVGLGESMQKHYYLPEAHTDFIFAIGAEELGIIFSVAVAVLFLAFFALSVYIARKASDRFGRMLVIGMAFIVFFQAMFNIGVVCEAFPTKGMALPFFSYGGTNLLSAMFAVGTILSVGIHSYRDRKREFLNKVLMR